jgi:hypothetical protein
MKAVLGIYSNASLCTVSLDVTHEQLQTAAKYDPECLRAYESTDEERHLVFEVLNSKGVSATPTSFAFPFNAQPKTAKIRVVADLNGASEQDNTITVAKLQKGLKIVEKQILATLKAMNTELKTVTVDRGEEGGE